MNRLNNIRHIFYFIFYVYKNVPSMLRANSDNTIVSHTNIEKNSKYNLFKHMYSLVILENITGISDLRNSIKYVRHKNDLCSNNCH